MISLNDTTGGLSGAIDLQRLISPLAPREFWLSFQGTQPFLTQGDPSKFTALFSWGALNYILTYSNGEHKYLHFWKDGKELPPDHYLERILEPITRAQKHRLSVPRILGKIRDGASLVINGVEDLWGPVADFVQRLSRQLPSVVSVNLYVGCSPTPGFELHFDDHDVFIIQVLGEKAWALYGLTQPFPVEKMKPSDQPPASAPVWEGTLSAGSCLYIPRGWWHKAVACGTPTIHLTVGLYHPTALTFLHWLIESLKQHDVLRRDIPQGGQYTGESQYLSDLRRLLTTALATPSIIDTYLQHLLSLTPPRTDFQLPLTATSNATSALSQGRLHFLTQREPRTNSLTANGEVELIFGGMVFRFGRHTADLFDYLIAREPADLSHFFMEFSNRFSFVELTQFVQDLVVQGIASIHSEQ